VTRESAAVKARRYLAEGRLTVERVDDKVIIATCKGAGEVYFVAFKRGRWQCDCRARGSMCAHLLALQTVTVNPRSSRRVMSR